MKNQQNHTKDNVIHLFTRKPWHADNKNQIIRMSPELDGLEMLYRNDSDSSKIFSIKILCWIIDQQGQVDALVPWLNGIQNCRSFIDPLNGHWEGYCDSTRNNIFFYPPKHKERELSEAACYFSNTCDSNNVIQEIPDTIGTHAIFTTDNFKTVKIIQIISWQLKVSGEILAMIPDTEKVTVTPVLAGDSCLIPAQEQEGFKYFFHHTVANQLKNGDSSIMESFNKLCDIYNSNE